MNNKVKKAFAVILATSLVLSGFGLDAVNAKADETNQANEQESQETNVTKEVAGEDLSEESKETSKEESKEISKESVSEADNSKDLKAESEDKADESETTDEETELEKETEDEKVTEEEEETKEDDSIKAKKLKKTSFDIDGVSSATMSKYSSKVSFSSAKSYGGLYEDKFEAAAYLIPEEGEEEGAFVAAGYTFGASDDPDWEFAANMEASPKYGHTYNEAIVVCFDKDHAVDWVWESDRVGVSYFLAVDVIADGSIVAAGRVRDYESSRTAMYIVKINPNDPEDYTEYIINSPSGAGYEFNGIVPTEDGGFVASGYTSFLTGYIASKKAGESDFSEKTQIWQNADGEDESLSKRASAKGFNGFVMKFDKDMNVKFVSFENYGAMEDAVVSGYSASAQRTYGVDVDNNGDIVAVGYTALAKGNANAVISKWDGKTGELISHRMAGTSDPTNQDNINLIDAKYLSVAALNDGSYVVTGTATNDATTEENWKCYGSADVIVVRYSADLSTVMYSRNIGTVDGLSGSLTANNGTQMEGVKASNDGGYILFGTSNTTLVERDLLDEGYTWKNYGSNDGIIVKYDSNNNVSWCQNYGTTGGDWIYDVITRENETEITVVGQTSGQYGTPAWEWHGQAASSTNPYDAFVMCTNMYSAAYTEPKASSELSGVLFANGTYQGEGIGRGGTMNFDVVVENNRISSITCTSHNETTEGGETSPYARATALFDTIVSAQSTDVDAVSGATMTSNGIKSGVENAMAKASAQTAINAIAKIAGYTAANASTTGNINNVLAAINYYTALTDYEREFVTNSDDLYAIADIFGFDVEIEKTEKTSQDDTSEESLKYNDTYLALQNKYYACINADSLEEHGLTGEGVKIAVIDSGLVGNSADIDYSRILPGWDYIKNLPMNDDSEGSVSLTDEMGHGTFVTGILVAEKNNGIGIAGLLSKANIIPLKISSGTDEQSSITAAQAIVDAVDKFDADVITTSVSLADTEDLKAAVDYAASKNVIVVGASGNSGTTGSMNDEYIYPASYENVISVGAVDSAGRVRSNSTKNDKVFVTAPGQQILSLGLSAKGYKCYVKSGTSYSSPVIAAMAAVAKQKNADISVEEFKKLLKETSADKGDEGYDNAYGYGLIDIKAFAEKIAPKAIDPSSDENTSSTENTAIAKNTTSATGDNQTSQTTAHGSGNSKTASNKVASTENGTTETATTKTTTTKSTSTKTADNQTDEETGDEVTVSDEAVPAAANDEEEAEQGDEAVQENTEASETSEAKAFPIIPIVIAIIAVLLVGGFVYFKKRK